MENKPVDNATFAVDHSLYYIFTSMLHIYIYIQYTLMFLWFKW